MTAIRVHRRTADGSGEDLPDLAADDWMHHSQTMARTGFWAVVRRLPAIVADAVGLGWRASRTDTLAALGLNLAAGVMTTLGLLATSSVLRQLFVAGPTPDRIRAALPALATAGTVVAARGAMTVAAGWAQARLTPRINIEVEVRLFEATTAVELAAFDDPGFAEEMERSRDRGMGEAVAIVDSTVNLVTGVVAVAATATATAFIAPPLMPCVLVAAAPSAITAFRIARREYVAMLARIDRRRRMWMLASVMANRHTAAEIRAFQMGNALLGEYRHTMAGETRAMLRLARTQAGTRSLGMALGGVGSLAVYGLLGALLVTGRIPLAAATTALIALQSTNAGLRTAIAATNKLYESALYYGDYRTFLDRARSRTSPSGGAPIVGFAQITADAVSLDYPDSARGAVRDVSVTIRKGEVVAFVGENGSGKTSLARMLAGLYRPTAGTIRWDGVDVAAYDAAALAGHVTVLSQEWWKFPFTAERNIAVGRSDQPADGDLVRAAARDAGADTMISALPYGYGTLLSRNFRRGQDLSGGQWQRLIAARGLYRGGSLLICDEPSAALDARAEQALFAQLGRRPDRAVVLITHRLANVRDADRIYVMDSGRIAEHGTHDELIAAGHRYADLWRLQAGGYETRTPKSV